MAQRITDQLVRSNEFVPSRGQKIIFDSHLKGFGVRFTCPSRRHPMGARTFVVDYWLGGRQRRYSIGQFPTHSVEHARIVAKDLRRRIDAGEDPMETKTKLRTDPTGRDLAERYFSEHLCRKRPQSQRDDKNMIEKEFLPRFENKKIASIHQGDIRALHSAITNRGAPVRANRVLALMSKMFALTLVPREGETLPWRNALVGNPCMRVERNPETPRDRFFSASELEEIADALRRYTGTHMSNLIRFLMLTGARPGEAMQATWEQINFTDGTWTKPSAHTKQGRTHHVPLGPAAIELLQKARLEIDSEVRRLRRGGRDPHVPDCPFVFPGRKRSGIDWQPPRQYRTAWAFVKRTANLRPDAEGNEARVYDLRHTFATAGAGQGLPLLLIGKLLGHTQHRTTQRYAHVADDPLRRAVNKINDEILKPPSSGEVLQFDSRTPHD